MLLSDGLEEDRISYLEKQAEQSQSDLDYEEGMAAEIEEDIAAELRAIQNDSEEVQHN
jgi:hypothetical protein